MTIGKHNVDERKSLPDPDLIIQKISQEFNRPVFFVKAPQYLFYWTKNKIVSETFLKEKQTMTLCEVRTIGEITIVAMPLQIDHVAALTLDHELRELVARGPKALFCDFSPTKYISSSGLRIILKTAKTVKADGGHFGVFSLTPFVDHIFTMSGFSGVLFIYDNEEAAIRAVSRKVPPL